MLDIYNIKFVCLWFILMQLSPSQFDHHCNSLNVKVFVFLVTDCLYAVLKAVGPTECKLVT
jgi:hypothetical protein